MAHWATGPGFLYEFLSDELRRQILAELLDGTSTTCFCMSEPDAGSDAWAMRTRAVLEDGEWVLCGTKQWITNGPSAQYAFVFAVTDPDLQRQRRGGITCFLVPTNRPGFKVDSVIKLFGNPGGNEAILSFQDLRLPPSHVVGDVDRGFELALRGVTDGRMYNAGRSLGLARWALEKATEYAKVRTTFGNPISSYQGVSFKLAESAMEIYATRCMALDCSRRIDEGEVPHRDMSILKAFSTEMCFQVLDRCMQIHGGMGLTNEAKLYDGWHQARIIRIADGSAEIMRRNIASRLLHGDTAF
jgi:acyl-CoA dehydrogenase